MNTLINTKMAACRSHKQMVRIHTLPSSSSTNTNSFTITTSAILAKVGVVLAGEVPSQLSTQERDRFESASPKVKMSTSLKALQTGTTPGWSSKELNILAPCTSERR